MSAFEHVIALLSFVYALALTHLLLSIAAMIRAGSRVRFSIVFAFWMANAFVVIIANWISLWDIRALQSFGVGTILFTFMLAFVNYIQAALVCPELPSQGALDLWEFHQREGRRYLAAVVASLVMAVLANIIYGGVYSLAELSRENVATIPMLVISLVAAIYVRAWWIQIACVVAMTGLWTFYLLVLQGALR